MLGCPVLLYGQFENTEYRKLVIVLFSVEWRGLCVNSSFRVLSNNLSRHIQLFQLTLSDESRPTRQDRRVIWDFYA